MNRFVLCIALGLIPSTAVANCGDGQCAVGGFGQGGQASDGGAQGGVLKLPSPHFPGSTLSFIGTEDAGRINSTGQGSLSGVVKDGTDRGHGTGIFGDWSGQCDDDILENFPEDC
jgi:hypothetical protein